MWLQTQDDEFKSQTLSIVYFLSISKMMPICTFIVYMFTSANQLVHIPANRTDTIHTHVMSSLLKLKHPIDIEHNIRQNYSGTTFPIHRNGSMWPTWVALQYYEFIQIRKISIEFYSVASWYAERRVSLVFHISFSSSFCDFPAAKWVSNEYSCTFRCNRRLPLPNGLADCVRLAFLVIHKSIFIINII